MAGVHLCASWPRPEEGPRRGSQAQLSFVGGVAWGSFTGLSGTFLHYSDELSCINEWGSLNQLGAHMIIFKQSHTKDGLQTSLPLLDAVASGIL